jgi:ribosomal protein S18 acetylase RimI-like enzyme
VGTADPGDQARPGGARQKGDSMSLASTDVIRWGRERARTGRWRGDAAVAFINPMPDAPLPSPEFLRRCLDTLAARGYRRVVTGALSPLEQAGFLAVGFGVEERLHLLGIDLTRELPPIPPGYPMRRVRHRQRKEILAVDQSAFSAYWRFDSAGLSDALHATPSVRFRAAIGPGDAIAGYAICGRSGRRGFVQRLAVSPDHQRSGTGRRLLLDGLDWMRRRRVLRAVVNTQLGNDAALALYTGIGFREEPTGLSVLSTGLP